MKAWGVPGDLLSDDWRGGEGALLTYRATYPRRPSARPGDRLFYYAVGHRVVFGIYEVTSLPFPGSGDDRWEWQVKVERIIDLEFLHDGIPLEDLNVDGRDLLISMRQKSAIRLHKPEAEAAERELRQRAEGGANHG